MAAGGLVVKEADLCLRGHRFNSYQPPGVTEVLWAWQCAHSDPIRAEQWSYFKPGVQGTVSCQGGIQTWVSW